MNNWIIPKKENTIESKREERFCLERKKAIEEYGGGLDEVAFAKSFYNKEIKSNKQELIDRVDKLWVLNFKGKDLVSKEQIKQLIKE